MTEFGKLNKDSIREDAEQIRADLYHWWTNCPPKLRDQPSDWRRRERITRLTVSETMEEEGATSIIAGMYGLVIYLNHIIDPFGQESQSPDMIVAIREILDIARETPEGYGLEMGLYWGLFMAGVAIFNDLEAEALLRKRLTSDSSISIYVSCRSKHLALLC